MHLSRLTMVERWSALLGAVCAATLMCSSHASAGPAPKVEICHIPPGNPANAHTIRVSGNAIKAHLKHGDTVGPCEAACPDGCDDGNACTIDRCDAGACSHAPVSCNDGEQCTLDSCNPETGGCEYVPQAGEPCSGQGDSACTLDTGFCSAGGECFLTGVPDCCESDSECADEDLCTLEACVDNVCVPNGQVDCTPGSACLQSGCDPSTGDCVDVPIECEPPGPCEAGGFCDDVGGCTYSPIPGCCLQAEDCDDGNPCTSDVCEDFGLGYPSCDNPTCHDPVSACWQWETCDGSCNPILTEPTDCSDGDACSKDLCDDELGCDNTQPTDCGPPPDACSAQICQDPELGCESISNCSGDEVCNGETGLCESSLACTFIEENSFYEQLFENSDGNLPWVGYPFSRTAVPWGGTIDIDCESDGTTRSCSAQFDDLVGPLDSPGIAEMCLVPVPCPVGTISCETGLDQEVSVTQHHDIGFCIDNPGCRAACDSFCAAQGAERVESSPACEGFCREADTPMCYTPGDLTEPGPGFVLCGPEDTCDEEVHTGACGCQCIDVGAGTPAAPGEGILYLGFEVQLFFDNDLDGEADRGWGDDGELCTADDEPPDETLAGNCSPFTTSVATTHIPEAGYYAPGFTGVPLDGEIGPFSSDPGAPFPCADGALTTASGAVLRGAATYKDTRAVDFAILHNIVCE